jgi:hypothetical protein
MLVPGFLGAPILQTLKHGGSLAGNDSIEHSSTLASFRLISSSLRALARASLLNVSIPFMSVQPILNPASRRQAMMVTGP